MKSENKAIGKLEGFFTDIKGRFKSWLNRFKVNLNDKNHVKSRKKIEAMQILITIILIPVALSILASTITYGVSLIASVVAMIIGTPFAISLTRVMPETTKIIIF